MKVRIILFTFILNTFARNKAVSFNGTNQYVATLISQRGSTCQRNYQNAEKGFELVFRQNGTMRVQ